MIKKILFWFGLLFIISMGGIILIFLLIKPDEITQSKLLAVELVEIESVLPYRDFLSEEVSKVDVAWHMDHSLKVINGVIKNLHSSDPDEYRKEFNFVRMMVFAVGSMPRGVGKAPASTLPPEEIITEDILDQSNEAKLSVESLNSAHSHSHFNHPVFGLLDLEDSKRFLEIHTNHHLAIIRDIIEGQ